jgi:TonB-dependent receptor
LASLVSLACASAAHAQSTASSGENIEEVVVTGFRASLADALDNKRDSNQIIESVSAEDIGKFPDQNIAESLQRLSGVQIDRSNGQGTKVRIRGLSQNVTLLDSDIFLTGLELYTQGEGNFRETDSLEGIPSELLGGVDVYKSPNASQVEGGLGGIINFKTRNPFDLQDDTTLAGNLRYADSGEGWEPLGALVFGQKFGERFALIASVAYDKNAFQTDVLGGQNRGGWAFERSPRSHDRDAQLLRTGVPLYDRSRRRARTSRRLRRTRVAPDRRHGAATVVVPFEPRHPDGRSVDQIPVRR